MRKLADILKSSSNQSKTKYKYMSTHDWKKALKESFYHL